VTIQPVIHARLRKGTSHPVNYLPATEKNQIWYSTNTMPSGSDWIGIGVDLGYGYVTLTGNLL